jgi:hypothetical protein
MYEKPTEEKAGLSQPQKKLSNARERDMQKR